MKLLPVVLAMVALSSCRTATKANVSETESASASQHKKTPDEYRCSNSNGYSVGYTTTGFNGQSSFQISKGCAAPAPGAAGCHSIMQLLSVGGQELEIKKTSSEFIVTGTQAIPDLSVTKYSVNFPKSLLVDFGQPAKFDAKLKIVKSPTSIMGPQPGQHVTTTTEDLKCEATFVVF